nr:hypothetical protein [Tanacetum cinerariifolium]
SISSKRWTSTAGLCVSPRKADPSMVPEHMPRTWPFQGVGLYPEKDLIRASLPKSPATCLGDMCVPGSLELWHSCDCWGLG